MRAPAMRFARSVPEDAMPLTIRTQTAFPDAAQDPPPDRWLIVAPARLPRSPAPTLHTRWPHLSTELLQRIQPSVVVAPLMTPTWDILDLSALLARAGYAGRLVIQSPPLPRPELIRHEIRALYPSLGVDFSAQVA